MKKDLISKKMLPLLDKIYPYNREIRLAYIEPTIEILKTTLSISVAILVASFSVEVNLIKIPFYSFVTYPLHSIIIFQIISLWILLEAKSRIIIDLTIQLRELYMVEFRVLVKKLIILNVAELNMVEKQIKQLKNYRKKLKHLIFTDFELSRIIHVPKYYFEYFSIRSLEIRYKSIKKKLENLRSSNIN